MKCFKCNMSARAPFHVIVEANVDEEDKVLCCLCASKFIECLARWKDIDMVEELEQWKGH